MNALSAVDDLVKEYLAFRGFNSALRAFEVDAKADRDKGFQVERVVDHLLSHILNSDLVGLTTYWAHIDARFLSRLDHSFAGSIRKVDISLQRYFLVHAVQAGRVDKVTEFFEKNGSDFQSHADWRDWFVLPFLRSPEQHPTFEGYFSKQWAESVVLSLHNFLHTVFHSMPLPALLDFHAERQRTVSLEKQVTSLKTQLGRIREEHELNRRQQAEQAAAAQQQLLQQQQHHHQQQQQQKSYQRQLSNDDYVLINRENSVTDGPAPKAPRRFRPESQIISTSVWKENVAGALPSARTSKPDESPHRVPSTPSAATSASAAPDSPTQTTSDEEPFIILSQDSFDEHSGPVTHCRFSDEGVTAVSADIDGIVKVWSVSPSIQCNATIACGRELLALEWVVDRLLLLGLAEGLVKVYNVESKRTLSDVFLPSEYQTMVDIACAPQGGSFVTSVKNDRNEGALYSWNMKTMRRDSELKIGGKPINSVRYNHNGSMLVAGGSDGAIRVYDLRSSQSIMNWKAHDGAVCSAQYSFDETSVFSMGTEGQLISWDLRNPGKRFSHVNIHTFSPGSSYFPRAGVFALDGEGEYLLMPSPSTSGDIYRMTSATPVLCLGGHAASVVGVDWSPTLNTTITGSLDGTVRVTKLIKIDK